MTILDHPNHMLGCIGSVEEVTRSNHPNKSPKMPLHVSKDEGVIDFHVHYHVCYEKLHELYYVI